jgi:molecular chaperone GrpE
MCGDNKIKELKEELSEKTSLLDDKTQKLQETIKKLEETQKELSEKEKVLEENEEKLSEYLSHIQRLQADFENYKKHSEKQKMDIISYANEGLILKILDVYQDFELALNSCETAEELKEGLSIIYKKLKSTLEKEGLVEIIAKGEKFDPFKHEALMAENNKDYDSGMIIEELAKGYALKDKVIKYSMVKVCKK